MSLQTLFEITEVPFCLTISDSRPLFLNSQTKRYTKRTTDMSQKTFLFVYFFVDDSDRELTAMLKKFACQIEVLSPCLILKCDPSNRIKSDVGIFYNPITVEGILIDNAFHRRQSVFVENMRKSIKKGRRPLFELKRRH